MKHYDNFCKVRQNSSREVLYHLVPVHACNLAILPDNCNATQKIVPSNREARRNGPIFTWTCIIWVICMLQFYALFCNILIEKFQNCSLRTGCLAQYMALFKNNYWCKKCCISLFLQLVTSTHFPDYLQTPTFQIIT